MYISTKNQQNSDMATVLICKPKKFKKNELIELIELKKIAYEELSSLKIATMQQKTPINSSMVVNIEYMREKNRSDVAIKDIYNELFECIGFQDILNNTGSEDLKLLILGRITELHKKLIACDVLQKKLGLGIDVNVVDKVLDELNDKVFNPITTNNNLDYNAVFNFSTQELSNLLKNRSYHVKFNETSILIAKREIQCLFEIIKGRHAGEIAATLAIKQISVESYINNLKKKLGVSTKSELLAAVATNKLIEQILPRSHDAH